MTFLDRKLLVEGPTASFAICWVCFVRHAKWAKNSSGLDKLSTGVWKAEPQKKIRLGNDPLTDGQ
jgi:hypothetical protein